ncbi:uncharacterized protein LOC116195266 [Punica granatum]|uniref:Transmembrane protein 161B n=2 Tax=Punica granatum TaxID=22663 RepID=A0A218WTE0_PUNGR|nr:uncharacterized protein LOC116195266 [Punica granatum]OWM75630.1 hypothetical protein CDL15_Pgr021795 [Punica granatum]PKI32920.1 hypothetical protein CRG98_046694 [Punica granatum]
MLQSLLTFRNLLLHTSLSLLLSLLLSFLRFPSLLLHGLFTYIHPENLGQQNGLRAAIRRPGSDPSEPEPRKKTKSKDKFEFDENNAQIFRIKLDPDHLQTRIYYSEYHSVSVLSFVSLSCVLLQLYLGESVNDGVLASGSLIPVLLGFFAVSRLFLVLAKVSFEKSASRLSEKRLSLCFGGLGFIAGLMICSSLLRSVLDFDCGSIDGFWAVLLAFLMGCLAGLLYMPALKCARSFWLGTDQIRCNLGLISSGWFARTALYLTCILNIFTALLWINPFIDILINKKAIDSKAARLSTGSRVDEKLAGNVGMSSSEFAKFRLYCLLLSGLSQFIALRPNLQMYLNEAVLSWYQRLHASRVPDLDFSRAKVFLHNHYACLAVVHYFVPPALVLVFLGLSQIEGRPLGKFEMLCSQQPCFGFFKQVALLLAWWVVFVWSVFTSVTLVLYRRGFLYVS